MTQNLYDKGMLELKRQMGQDAEKYIKQLEAIYPKFAKVNVEFPFGTLYPDTDLLDARTREIATVAALTVLGYALTELKLHIKMALNCGATKIELLEMITQMIAYSGFPSTTNALLAADEVFKELGI